jgi:hypothetical protein
VMEHENGQPMDPERDGVESDVTEDASPHEREETFREGYGQKVAGPSFRPTSRAKPVLERSVMAGSDEARTSMLEKAIVDLALDAVAFRGITEDSLNQESEMLERWQLCDQERRQALDKLAQQQEVNANLRETIRRHNRLNKERGEDIARQLEKVEQLTTENAELRLQIDGQTSEPVVHVDVPEAQTVLDEADKIRKRDSGNRELQLASDYEKTHRLVLRDSNGRLLLATTDRVSVATEEAYNEESDAALRPLWTFMQELQMGHFKRVVLKVDVDEDTRKGKTPFPSGLQTSGTIARYGSGGWSIKGAVLNTMTAVPNESIESTQDGIVTLSWINIPEAKQEAL